MSQDELCSFWCLLDGEEKAFTVEVGLKWNVEQLAKAIREEKRDLRKLDASKIVLLKLNDPIPVDPMKTLLQRLPKPITDVCVELERTSKVSGAFPDRPEVHLQIIVKVPATKESLNRFRHFRNYYWGEDRIGQRIEAGKKISTLDLTPANIPELNNRSITTLIIRDEYQIAYDAILKMIETTPRNRVVFLFTGQPGTGKTLFLLVLLVLRLQQKQTVALQISVDEFVLFDEGGVSKYGKHDIFAIPKGAWTLSDSRSLEPCAAFQYSQGHLIHTSSPTSRHWKEWVKQLGAMRYVMDVWSLEEFRTLLTVSNFDIPRGETLFLRYGSNVRRITDILELPGEETVYKQDVQTAATNIARDFSTILLQLDSLDFKSELSSMIFTVRPNNLVERLGVLTIPTAYLFKAFIMAVSRQTLAQQHNIFTMLATHPSLGTAAGWWFKNYAHVRLSDPTRQPIPTHTRGLPNSSPIPAPNIALAGSTALRKIQPPFDFYWRPLERNFEGIDGLIRVGNTVRVEQYTTSSSHRSSATKGLDEIREIMNHIRGVEWHLDIVCLDLYVAEYVRDSLKLTGRWANTPIHACKLEFGIWNMQMLRQVFEAATDDTYPAYHMGSTATGFSLGPSLSTPVCILSGSSFGHAGMGSTGAHQSAQVSTRQMGLSEGRSNTPSAPLAGVQALRRSPRKRKVVDDGELQNSASKRTSKRRNKN